MIRCNNLCFRYPKNDFDTLHHINFTIQKGEWVSVIGKNGSGKSTLIQMLNGLHFPHMGEVWIDGTLLHAGTVWDIRQKVGMVFQNPENQFVGTTVFDDIAFGMENYGISQEEMLARVEWVLKEVGMPDFRYKAPQDLSGGQKQRIALAGILALKPKICILDEAMVMLDPMGRKQMLHLLQHLHEKYHMTILSVTHDLTELEFSERTLVLEAGRLIQDAPSAHILQNRAFRTAHQLGTTDIDILSDALQRLQIPVKDTYTSKEALVEDLWGLFSKK